MLRNISPFRQLIKSYGSVLSASSSLSRLVELGEVNVSANAALVEQLSEVLRVQARAPQADVDLYERMGLKLLLDRTSIVDRCMIDEGTWEQPQLDFFIGMLRRSLACNNSMFLDLGAYWGLYSLLAMKAGVRRIHSFDADRHNFAQFQAQLFLNSASGTITPHFKAVSAKSGILNCWDSRTHPDGNRGGVGIVDANLSTHPSYEVEAVAIDDYLSLQDELLFVKMDVEGHEHMALQGLQQTIKRNRVVMQVEVFENAEAQVRPVVDSLGLRQIHAIPPDFYFTNMSDEELSFG